MVNELNALESKIAEVASLCRALRAENAQLKQQLVTLESEVASRGAAPIQGRSIKSRAAAKR